MNDARVSKSLENELFFGIHRIFNKGTTVVESLPLHPNVAGLSPAVTTSRIFYVTFVSYKSRLIRDILIF